MTYGLRPAVPLRVTRERRYGGDVPRPGHCRTCDQPLREADVVGLACPGCVSETAALALPRRRCLGNALARGEAPWAAGELAEQPDCLALVHRDAAVVPPRERWMDPETWEAA